jgi:hypothetical protein
MSSRFATFFAIVEERSVPETGVRIPKSLYAAFCSRRDAASCERTFGELLPGTGVIHRPPLTLVRIALLEYS